MGSAPVNLPPAKPVDIQFIGQVGLVQGVENAVVHQLNPVYHPLELQQRKITKNENTHECGKKKTKKWLTGWMSMLRPRHPNISCISKGRTCNRRGQLAWADRSSACSSAQNKGICYWWPSGMQHLWLVSCCRPDGGEFQERCCPKHSQLRPEYQYDCVWDWCSTQSSVSLSMQAWIPVWKKRD